MSVVLNIVKKGEALFSDLRGQVSGDQVLQLTQDDKKVIQQIQSAHSPDANIVVDEKSILNICQNILHRASPSPLLDSKIVAGVLDEKSSAITDALAFTIHKIGCELSCNCTGEGDLKAITLSVFNILKNYAWDAKLVLVVAAFTASYGEFCLLSQLHASNTIAKSVYALKPLPDISERESLITELLKVVVQVADRIIDLIDLPTQYISQDKPPLSDALTLVPITVYLAIKGIVACSVQSIGLINVGHQYAVSITEARKKLTELAQTLKSYHVQLTNQLYLCQKHSDDTRNNLVFHGLVRIILETPQKDSMEIISAFINTKEDLPLFNGVNKKRVGLDVLKSQTVIFFFSYLNISDDDIEEIKQQVGKERKYEIVWIPIIDVPVISNEIKQEIQRKASLMPWYSLHYSLELHPGAIKFVKEKWNFKKKPVLVVFNAQGSIISQNAFHLLMTWGSQAYPFDGQSVTGLWNGTTWSPELLFDESDKAQLVKEGKIVVFFGGDDLDWIRKFTSEIKEQIKVEGSMLELIYVGKKHKETITKENLGKCWEAVKIKRFRERLENIMYSKMQLDVDIKTDAVLKNLMTVLGAEGSGEGWTLMSHGSKDVVTMNANLAMDWFAELKKNKTTITTVDTFYKTAITHVDTFYEMTTTTGDAPVRKHCNHIVIPNSKGINKGKMVCVECNRPMEKFVTFKCCVEE